MILFSRNSIKWILESFKDLIYPPNCLHCQSSTAKNSQLFCPACLSLLELIDHHPLCPYCFSDAYCPKRKRCSVCSRKDLVLNKIAAAFDYVGPAATLVRQLKYGRQPYLAKGAGAFLAAQFLQLSWPMPDFIVPVPISLTHWIERGYNQSLLLAEAVSFILNRPVKEPLKRLSGDYSQAGLDRKQRNQLKKSTFILKENQELEGKCLLLIDDVMTTGTTLRHCAEIMLEGFPSSIYGLSFCRALN